MNAYAIRICIHIFGFSPCLHVRSDPKASSANGWRRRRAEAAGPMDQPVRDQGTPRAQPQGPELRVRRGGRQEQEPAPPRVQSRSQEGARAHPRREARLRITGHRALHR